MEKFGTRKKTRDRFLVSGLFIEGFHAPQMSHLSRGKAASSFPECDIRMDGSDWKEINICDISSAAAENGSLLEKCPEFLLEATKLSHFRLAACDAQSCLREYHCICCFQFATSGRFLDVSETGQS